MNDVSVWVAFGLTLFVYSYLIGDSFLYRWAVYIFAGLSAGFVAVVIWDSALLPWLDQIQGRGGLGWYIIGALPFIMALSLLLPPIPIVGILRRLTLAFLIGVGAAVTVVGAVSGTLIPISVSVGRSVNDGWLRGIISIVGVVATLVYFQYSARRLPTGETRRPLLVRGLSNIGGIVLAITFGTIYAAAIGTAITVFSERAGFIGERFIALFDIIRGLIGG
ncbi:MAG: hypothetical protein ACOYL5_15630 [Phototrophicaceae bacterium]|jgi:hypothetical protein